MGWASYKGALKFFLMKLGCYKLKFFPDKKKKKMHWNSSNNYNKVTVVHWCQKKFEWFRNTFPGNYSKIHLKLLE